MLFKISLLDWHYQARMKISSEPLSRIFVVGNSVWRPRLTDIFKRLRFWSENENFKREWFSSRFRPFGQWWSLFLSQRSQQLHVLVFSKSKFVETIAVSGKQSKTQKSSPIGKREISSQKSKVITPSLLVYDSITIHLIPDHWLAVFCRSKTIAYT